MKRKDRGERGAKWPRGSKACYGDTSERRQRIANYAMAETGIAARGRSGARRAGQPRPGAPGSRPRIGSAADLLSFFTACDLSGSGAFFYFTALGHYPRNPAKVKRLRMQQTAYIQDSDKVIQKPYATRGSIRQILHSVRRSF
ncbi:hypothetical protein [Burkholderia territorii]|uniref:hypothetical protein n=1 Tax=Burkholderia territorii TaxID=1503055 RepID=UPI0012DB0122|nr:hypothetical protein [Burkholderia territorii]